MESKKALQIIVSVLILLPSIQLAHAIDTESFFMQSTQAYFSLDAKNENYLHIHQPQQQSQLFFTAEIDSTQPQNRIQAGTGYQLNLNSDVALNASLLMQTNTLNDKQANYQHRAANRNSQLALEAGSKINLTSAFRIYSALVYKVPEEYLQTTKTPENKKLGVKLKGEYYFSDNVSATIHAQIVAESRIYGVQGSFHF
ncbi:hypothetical protein [Catenovulum sediminis]|uniref:Outer membrane protein beta-barrel domain-containing protein n=1 Tax=Catenovulum sediminis TaxID=1740262 RepID=A0ABV1RH05_9ALTE|nr:hypothetical protein [Catenovulum sediminis]